MPAPGSSSPTWRRSPSATPRAERCWWPTCRQATRRPATRWSCSTTPRGRSRWPWRARLSSTPAARPPPCGARTPSSASCSRHSATSSARRSPPSRATRRRCSNPISPGTPPRPTASSGRSPARALGWSGSSATCSIRARSSRGSCDCSATGAISRWWSRRPRASCGRGRRSTSAPTPTSRPCGPTTIAWSRCSSTCSRTPSSTGRPATPSTCSLRRGTTPGTVEVEVSDQGPGIPPSIAGQIFQPRVRGTTDGGGAGLGLSIARGIVEAHGGTLACAPAERGASFVVTLRCDPPSEASEAHLDASWNLVDGSGEPDLVVDRPKDRDVV